MIDVEKHNKKYKRDQIVFWFVIVGFIASMIWGI